MYTAYPPAHPPPPHNSALRFFAASQRTHPSPHHAPARRATFSHTHTPAMAQSYPPHSFSSLSYGVPLGALDPTLAPQAYDGWLDAPAPAFPDPYLSAQTLQFYAPPAAPPDQLQHGGPQGTPFPPQWQQDPGVHDTASTSAGGSGIGTGQGHANGHVGADNAVAGALDPATGVFSRTTVEHPRMRTAQACEKCRVRKAKCSGDHPTCQRCLSRGLLCEYAPERKMRGPNRPKPHSSSPHRPSTAASQSPARERTYTRERANSAAGVFGTSSARLDGQDAAGLGVPMPPLNTGMSAGLAQRGGRAAPPGHIDLPMFVLAPYAPPQPDLANSSPPHSSGTSDSGTGTAPVTPRSLLDAAAHELYAHGDGTKPALRARDLVYPEPDELQLDGHGAQ